MMVHRTEQAPAPLLIVFLLRKEGQDIHLHCRGCRELDASSRRVSDEAGRIEFDGQRIPVLDAGRRVSGSATEIGPSTCLVVVENKTGDALMRVGVLVRDLDEVMHLAAGEYTGGSTSLTSPNVRLILELCEEQSGRELAEDIRPLGSRLAAALSRMDERFLSRALA
jgi:hypothetical protein